MEIERNYLIMLLYGYYMCKYPGSPGKDLMIHLDNHFTASNNPILTDVEKQLVDDLYDEVWISLKVQGLNRKNIRKIGKRK